MSKYSANLKVGNLTLAAETCCSFDLALVQFETPAEFDCFNQAFLGNSSTFLVFFTHNFNLFHVSAYFTGIPLPSIDEYYIGLFNYGCDPVFTWCPSGIPTFFKYFSFNKNWNAGVLGGRNGKFADVYGTRNVVGLKRFVCESK